MKSVLLLLLLMTISFQLFSCGEDDAKVKTLKFLRTNENIAAVVDMRELADDDIEIMLSDVYNPSAKAAIYSFDGKFGRMSGMIMFDYHETKGAICVRRFFSHPAYSIE